MCQSDGEGQSRLDMLTYSLIDRRQPAFDENGARENPEDLWYGCSSLLGIWIMPRPVTRGEVLERLQKLAKNGETIVGAGAGQ